MHYKEKALHLQFDWGHYVSSPSKVLLYHSVCKTRTLQTLMHTAAHLSLAYGPTLTFARVKVKCVGVAQACTCGFLPFRDEAIDPASFKGFSLSQALRQQLATDRLFFTCTHSQDGHIVMRLVVKALRWLLVPCNHIACWLASLIFHDERATWNLENTIEAGI